MFKIVSSLLLLTILHCVNGQTACPAVNTFPNLSPEKYLGAWYEIERFPIKSEEGLRCIKVDYSVLDPVELIVKVNNTGINKENGKFESQAGTARPKSASELSKLVVTYEFGPIVFSYDYWIIDTDYTNYSLVYSCNTVLGQKTEYAWILARERTLDPNIIAKLVATLQKAGATTSAFIKTEQNC